MDQRMLKTLQSWTTTLVRRADFSTQPISLAESKEWVYLGGKLTHSSGLFFNVVGAQWQHGRQVECQPLIEQREIGTLGFMICGNEILIQAKIEPGNVNVCQIAPTYQATASNAARAHGGKTPHLKRWFLPTSDNILYQTLNSEQGSRFLGKLNRNTLITTKRKLRPGPHHRWLPISDLLSLMAQDHLINTDARSVLVCAPWGRLVEHQPFRRYDTSFSRLLADSYLENRHGRVEQVIEKLLSMRLASKEPIELALDKIPGWTMKSFGIQPNDKQQFRVRQIRVRTKMREVPTWDQPIVDSLSRGAADVYCGRRNGKLYFLLRPIAEIGLLHRVELGPSFLREPGKPKLQRSRPGKVMASVSQSDEGGRFFQDITRYRIIDVGQIENINKEEFWLSLGEINELLCLDGFLTNEARSALSLLLQWL